MVNRVDFSDTAHNLSCTYRFACGNIQCPDLIDKMKPPACYIEKFSRYQPEPDKVWHQKSWEEVKRVTWRDVFSLRETWIYILLIVISVVFIFMVMIAIKVLQDIN